MTGKHSNVPNTAVASFLLLCLVFVLSAHQIVLKNRKIEIGSKYELLNALLSDPLTPDRPLTPELLWKNTSTDTWVRTEEDIGDFPRKWIVPSSEEFVDMGFPESQIEGGVIREHVLRSHPTLGCQVVSLSTEFVGVLSAYVPSSVNSDTLFAENPAVSVVDASDCWKKFGSHLVYFKIYDLERSAVFYLFPRDFIRNLPRLFLPDPPFEVPAFSKLPELTASFDTRILDHFKISEDYFLFTEQSANWSSIVFLSEQTGQLLLPEYIDRGLAKLFSDLQGKGSFAGLSAPNELIAKYGVVLIAFTVWGLYRRLATFDETMVRNAYWIPLDGGRLERVILAIAYALTPYLLVVTCFVAYAAAMEFTFVNPYFHIKIDADYSLMISEPIPTGWLSRQGFEVAVLAIFWSFSIVVSGFLSLELVGIIARTARRSRVGKP